MKQRWLFIFFILLVSGCAHHTENYANVDTTNLSQLESVQVDLTLTNPRTDLSGLRSKSLRDSAMSIGAQAGLSSASEKMNKHLEKDHQFLDTIFNFNAMMLSHGVIPPVLEEGDYTLSLADPNTIRVSDRTYRIVAQARFTTTAPNWREYLWLSYPKPELPDRALLPKNKDEQKIWKEGINIGWEKGVQQAYSIFQQNLARLKRDFRGMALYRKLLQEHMISAPFVARTELGVTGDGNDMRVNDQVLRIVELPKLQTNSKKWNAIIVKQDG